MTDFNKFKRSIANLNDMAAHENASVLNNILANEFALFTKTLNFHWNITGPRFHSLHNFFEEQYKELLEIMDDTAERVRFLGKKPHGTVEKMFKEMNFKETPNQELSSSEMLGQLFEDHLKIQSMIKESMSDKELFGTDLGTKEFLGALLQKHEMMSWKLSSHFD